MSSTTLAHFVAFAGAGAFLLLTLANYHIGKTWLYPAAALSGAWLLVFLGLCISASWLYPVTPDALVIYLMGAIYYSFGAYLAFQFGGAPDKVYSRQIIYYRSDFLLLLTVLAVLVAGFPFYYHEITGLTRAAPFTPLFYWQLRTALLRQAWTMNRVPIVNDLVDLSNIGAIIGMLVSGGGRRWKGLVAIMIVVSLIYNLLTAAKIGFASLAVELTVIYTIHHGRLKKRFVLLAASIFFAGFGAITVALREATAGTYAGMQQIALTVKTLLNYLTVSVVGFGVYLRHPKQIPVIYSVWFFFEHTVNYFGHYFQIPVQHGAYVSVGPGLEYNTYTAYFTYYPQWGAFGVALILFIVGFVSTRAYKASMHGSFIGALLYAYLYYGTCMTMFNESLFLTLNFLAKLLVVGYLFIAARHMFPKWLRDARRQFRNYSGNLNQL